MLDGQINNAGIEKKILCARMGRFTTTTTKTTTTTAK